MAAVKQVGRLAGLAVSVGIGLAVATGVAGEAAAESPDSTPAKADSGSHQRSKPAWTGTDHLVAASELSTIPMEYFEAVDVSSIAVDPSVGWQTH